MVADDVYCVDSSVLAKFPTREEPAGLSDAATAVVTRAVTSGRIVVPAFAWAEVGSVLRKKARQGVRRDDHAATIWELMQRLPAYVRHLREAA